VNLPQWLAENLGKQASEASSPIYGTLLDGRNMYEEGAIPNKAQGIIIMGNEGNGIAEEVRRFITHPLYIPSYKQSEGEVVESLNVSIATAIILAEFRR
jgi:TrmH family RNA methyltransferase